MRWLIGLCLLLAINTASAFTARSWLIADTELNIEAGENFFEVRSIASLTKLLTVMVALDDHTKEHGLVKMAMVRSSNFAADQLCRHHSGGYNGCIDAMNAKARWLGAIDTRVYEPTGLSPLNRSTAVDIAKIIRAASLYPEIVAVSQIDNIRISKRKIAHNTNPLVTKYNTVVSKTGWTVRAGGCLAMIVGDRVIVLLGSKNTHTRVTEMQQLIESLPGGGRPI
jgi:D-alanyl-D-alanine endopeptidase (penicillin-binding protein 7)